jgi:hypothetical protein
MPRRLARETAHVAAVSALLSPVVALGCSSDAAPGGDRGERLGTARSAIVGGEPSTSEDDFVVLIEQVGKPSLPCGATLVARVTRRW